MLVAQPGLEGMPLLSILGALWPPAPGGAVEGMLKQQLGTGSALNSDSNLSPTEKWNLSDPDLK